GHSDRLDVVIHTKELKALAHGVLIGPEPSRGGLVDDGDLRTLFTIGAVKLPPTQDPDAHGLKVIGCDVIGLRKYPIPCRSALFPFREDAARNSCSSEQRNIGAEGNGIDAREGLRGLNCPPLELAHSRRDRKSVV